MISIEEQIYVRQGGHDQGMKVFMIHGFGDCHTSFIPLLETDFAQTHRLFLLDLPGFGASPWQASIRTIQDYGVLLAHWIERHAGGQSVGLVAHSIGGAIAVAVAEILGNKIAGLFSLEGNLSEDDAYFTGRAVDFEDAHQFKRQFQEDIWHMAQTNTMLRRFSGCTYFAHAEAMWHLGCDAKKRSPNHGLGEAYRVLACPKLYLWGAESTPPATRTYMSEHNLRNHQFFGSTHWATIEDPHQVSTVMAEFFSEVMKP